MSLTNNTDQSNLCVLKRYIDSEIRSQSVQFFPLKIKAIAATVNVSMRVLGEELSDELRSAGGIGSSYWGNPYFSSQRARSAELTIVCRVLPVF